MKLSARRVARIRYSWWFSDGIYDLVERLVPARWSERAIDRLEKILERPVVDWLLPRLCAHDEAIPDCPNPDHDVCRGCDKPMPGMARR